MERTKLIFINTISQYLRTGLCMVLSLYSTRLILAVLGQSDFGIYALIGSLVMMLSFITSSLATSTQRFLSYSWGKNDLNEIKIIFSNAWGLHFIISLFLTLLLLLTEHAIVHDYMSIPPDRIEAADFVYYTIVLMLTLTFMTAPVKALFIARENIVYTSIIDVVDSILKLLGAMALTYITYDSLKVYSLLMAGISAFTFLAYSIYAFIKYEECHIPLFSEFSSNRIRQLFSFTVWNVYAVGSTIIRTQGLAIIINKFLGTIVNAAYGIALQVSNAVSSVAASILNSMNPQLMKAEGGGDRSKMLQYATKESKYSYLMLSCILIPIVIEMPAILTAWLKEYPPYTIEFCRMVVIATIFDQATIGLTSANQAEGNIRNYSLITSTIRLIIIPSTWMCLYFGFNITSVICCYLLFELICGLSRIPLIHHTAGLNIVNYCKEVFVKPLFPIIGNIFACVLVIHLMDGALRFFVTESVGILTTGMLTYCFALDQEEKSWISHHITIWRHD